MNPHSKGWAWAQKHRPIYINVDAVIDAFVFAVLFLMLTAFLGS